MLQFDKSFGFDVEYHRRCAYDSIHIFDSDATSRFGRLCGPKGDNSVPYDGNRKIIPDPKNNNRMLIWDEPFNTHSYRVHIAFDTDQSFQFNGFKLDWSTEILTYNLNDLNDAMNYIQQQMIYTVKRTDFKDSGSGVIRRRTNGYFRSMLRILELERICALNVKEELPCKFISVW